MGDCELPILRVGPATIHFHRYRGLDTCHCLSRRLVMNNGNSVGHIMNKIGRLALPNSLNRRLHTFGDGNGGLVYGNY